MTEHQNGNGLNPSRPARDFSQSKRAPRNQATLLVDLVQENALQLFHTPQRVAYVSLSHEGHSQTLRIRSKNFRDWLARCFYSQYSRVPRLQALQDALGVIEGIALFEGEELQINVRLAALEGKLYLDLGLADGSVIEMGPTGWQVIQQSPVRFYRPQNLLALPLPKRGGQLSELSTLLNILPEDWSLLAAWLIAALNPQGPYPVLFLLGEQGTGKSTLAQMLKGLIDPGAASLRAHPRDSRDLMLAAANSWVLCFDNLSQIPGWFSDGLCRLSTGGSFATRALYHDNEESIVNAARPVILTGIEDLATRGDLLDRAILLYLPAISPGKRCSHQELWTQYEALRPQLLGALLDIVCVTLAQLPQVKLEQLPRMADFAKLGVAASPALGLQPEDFLNAYQQNQQATHELTLEGLPVVTALKTLLEKQPTWEGTATDLHAALTSCCSPQMQRGKNWSTSARGLSSMLRRLAPSLRSSGIEVCFHRTRQARLIQIVTSDTTL